MKKFVLLAMLLVLVLALSACGEDTPEKGATVSYQVTVVDGFDNPYTEKVIVKFIEPLD